MRRLVWIAFVLLGFYILVNLLPALYWQFLLVSGRPELDVASDRAIVKAGKKLRKKYGLYPVCFGGSCTDAGVTSFALDVYRYGPAFDRDEARELVLECLTIFHKVVNEDENVRKFLASYPFPLEGVNIGIYNHLPSGYSHVHPDILIVEYGGGQIQYLTESLEDRHTHRYTSRYEEPYEEAVAIVKKQRMERQAALGIACPVDEARLSDS